MTPSPALVNPSPSSGEGLRALMVDDASCPWVDLGDGSLLKVVRVDIPEGLWVIRNLFRPGFRVPTHRHTGSVLAFTLAGSWKYEEYPDVNTAGSFLYEPAGSVHTLTVPEDNAQDTDVWFVVQGANLNLTPEGEVEMVVDAALVWEYYRSLCAELGVVPGTQVRS